jgi:hypothetical protein
MLRLLDRETSAMKEPHPVATVKAHDGRSSRLPPWTAQDPRQPERETSTPEQSRRRGLGDTQTDTDGDRE